MFIAFLMIAVFGSVLFHQKEIQSRGEIVNFPEKDKIELVSDNESWGDKVIDKTVVVESGVKLHIKKGSTIKFERKEGEIPPFIFVEQGGLIYAPGTEKEKIHFTSDQKNSAFSIIFEGRNGGPE